jgi:hypothetical protein
VPQTPAIVAAGRGAPDIETLPGAALITRKEVAAVTGFATVTLRLWAKKDRGPPVTFLEGRPRYRVRDVREWMGAA